MAFQHWVAYGRTDSPHSRTKEHLTCPLLWCRHSFDSLESCLQHVSTCQWLPNAWYWCHQCRRAELFTPEEPSSALPCLHSVRRKDSKLKRAVSFFKQMRRRSYSPQSAATIRGDSVSSATTDPRQQSHDEKQCTIDRSEADSTSDLSVFDANYLPPMAQRSADAAFSLVERPPTLYDMEANALSPLRGYDVNDNQQAMELPTSDPMFNSVQLGDTVVSELPVSAQPDVTPPSATRSHPPSHYGPFSLSMYICEPEVIVSPVSPHFGRVPIASRLTNVTAPVSPLDAPFHTTWPAIDGCSDNVDTEPNHGNALAHLVGYCEKSDDQPATNLLPAESSKPTSLASGIMNYADRRDRASSEKLVDELHELVCGLHSHWIEKLPEYTSIESRFCGLNPFEAALRALQQCFQGAPPMTFEGVLSIMQLSYACAYLLNEANYSWHTLFKNVLELQNLIQCDEHRFLYLGIVHSLWGRLSILERPLQTTHYSAGKDKVLALPPVPLQDLEGMDIDRGSPLDISQSLATCSSHASQMLSTSDLPNAALSSALREGSVIRACCDYLDGALCSSFPIAEVVADRDFLHSSRIRHYQFTTRTSRIQSRSHDCLSSCH